ncbi:MAG: hydroxymethylbilane synthase [Acidimicrobiales bacterium]
MMMRPLRLATRGSPLARWQAEYVAGRLRHAGAGDVELVVVSTAGDRNRDVSLHQIGGQGVFVKEVQAAVQSGDADLAVHSAKDLPAVTPEDLVLASVPVRADPRDAIVGTAFSALVTGATVATGSVRRRAQLAYARPDLSFEELRGNMHTRIDRARALGAGVVAYAALLRLGLEAHVAEVLDPSLVLPQVAQGALAVECRRDDVEVHGALSAIDDVQAHRAVRAERAFLAGLGGGCSLPVGALATVGDDGVLHVEAMVASADGHVALRRRARGGPEDSPEALGAALAVALLDDDGASAFGEWGR